MAKTKKSKTGFWFVDGIFEPQVFEKEKFANDEDPKIKEYLKKLNEGKIKLCEILWNKEGPPDGKHWMFTCADECPGGDKDSFCELRVIYRNNKPDDIKHIEGKQGSLVGPPKDFIKHVLIVYCECSHSSHNHHRP